MKKKLVLLAAGLSLVISMNAQFYTQNILGDLNTHPNDFAAYAASIGTLNRPSAYGSILGLRFWDGGGSDWRTQLAFGTDGNFYFRQSTNSAGNSWTSWFNIYHSGNFNRSDVDFTAQSINCSYIKTSRSGISIDGSLYGNQWGIGKDNTMGLYFYEGGAANSYRFILKDGGNVGIGTTNPYAAKLHVDKAVLGDVGGSIFITNTASATIGNRSRLGFDLVGFDDIIPTASIDGILSNTNGTSDLIFNAYDGSTLNTYEKMRILGSNGNILIGKTSQVGTGVKYKLDVAGPIRADEIVVNTTGADFVFEPTYKLRPLAEVETFINQHKHLPDVAPAADMQTNGVSMGEMQAKLLQKVEELTLYSIEQEKKLQEQKTQLQEQQQSNTDVRQQLAEQAKQNEELKQEIEQLKQLITQKLK